MKLPDKTRPNYWAVKHGMSRTRIYRIYVGMKQRCNNPNNRLYKYYGGRGISICDEWSHKDSGFMSFYHWSMANGYSKDLSIDRIDVNGNYTPDNCRWANSTIQNINMRSTRNTSGYVGISRHTCADRWYGRVKINGKTVYTGMSKNILEAAKMRDQYIIDHKLPNKLNNVLEPSELEVSA